MEFADAILFSIPLSYLVSIGVLAQFGASAMDVIIIGSVGSMAALGLALFVNPPT